MATELDIEALARDYLRAEDPAAAGRLLELLVYDFAQPLVEKVVAAKLGRFAHTAQDIEDVSGEATIALLGKLEEWRSAGAEPESSFSGYAAVTAYHACDDYFRARFPQRHRLKNRLRYLLKPARGFDLWRCESGELVCGRAAWRNRQLRPVCDTPIDSLASGLPSQPERLLPALFDRSGGPLEFDDAVSIAALVLGIRDQPVPLESIDRHAAPAEETGAFETHVRKAWDEIRELPLPQRTALLLNLRGETEASAVELFPHTGIASVSELAGVLEIPALEFAEMWNRLPLGDGEIARRLGITRQQVINLRLAARKRLGRRLNKAIGTEIWRL